jgi:hypothetical protein
VKGRYKAKADVRRDWVALETRAAKAEQSADRLATELTGLLAKYGALQESYQRQVRALKESRVAGDRRD